MAPYRPIKLTKRTARLIELVIETLAFFGVFDPDIYETLSYGCRLKGFGNIGHKRLFIKIYRGTEGLQQYHREAYALMNAQEPSGVRVVKLVGNFIIQDPKLGLLLLEDESDAINAASDNNDDDKVKKLLAEFDRANPGIERDEENPLNSNHALLSDGTLLMFDFRTKDINVVVEDNVKKLQELRPM